MLNQMQVLNWGVYVDWNRKGNLGRYIWSEAYGRRVGSNIVQRCVCWGSLLCWMPINSIDTLQSDSMVLRYLVRGIFTKKLVRRFLLSSSLVLQVMMMRILKTRVSTLLQPEKSQQRFLALGHHSTSCPANPCHLTPFTWFLNTCSTRLHYCRKDSRPPSDQNYRA